MSKSSSNPHYEGAAGRERQLKGWKSRAKSQVNASPNETMRRMKDTAPNNIQPGLASQVAMGNEMWKRAKQDQARANQARLQYRHDRARYMLGNR